MASLWRSLHVPSLAVENTNKRIRHFMPGETDLSGVTQQQLVDLAHHLNAQPRTCPGYKIPAEASPTLTTAMMHLD
jgi:IS30 family transposase